MSITVPLCTYQIRARTCELLHTCWHAEIYCQYDIRCIQVQSKVHQYKALLWKINMNSIWRTSPWKWPQNEIRKAIAASTNGMENRSHHLVLIEGIIFLLYLREIKEFLLNGCQVWKNKAKVCIEVNQSMLLTSIKMYSSSFVFIWLQFCNECCNLFPMKTIQKTSTMLHGLTP